MGEKFMDYRRMILYALLAFVGFTLWNEWQKDYPPQTPATATEQQAAAVSANVPPMSASATQSTATTATTTAKPAMTSAPAANVVQVHTDVMNASIDTQGGNIVELDLPKYPQSTKTPNIPVQLLNNDPNTLYVAQSGLLSPAGPDTQQGQATYTASQTEYTLPSGQNQLDVKLTWHNASGLEVIKTITFQRGKYNISVNYQINNNSNQDWSGQVYGQIRRKPESTSSSIFSLHTYNGVSISTPEEPYEKISYSKMEKANLDRTAPGGWLAMQQRYFLSAWIPPQNQTNHFYSSVDPNNVYTIGFVGPVFHVPAGSQATQTKTFYAGPEIADTLKALAPHLDLTIDYGWLWPISVGIFWIMRKIYTWVGNWGWSIVLVTLLIKLVFYKLSETSYRSMAKMRKLTPRLQALKERYGDDRAKLSQATMELYKKEKANPLSGCLPMLIQIPFFIALYYVLVESVELRQAPFILWIHDLSAQDPYYVLPILMGISMFLQQRLSPPPADPMQAKIMMLLPVLFTIFFLAFPAGLVLYWLVNNCLGALQQWYITRRVEMQEKAKK